MDELERRQNSNFLDAEGINVPRQLNGHEVTRFTRIALLELLEETIANNGYDHAHLKGLWLYYFEEYGADFPDTSGGIKRYLRKYIEESSGTKVLALIEAYCRAPFCSESHFQTLQKLMQREKLPYRLVGEVHDDDNRPTLMPVSSPEQGEALVRDYAAIGHHVGAEAVRRHLRAASAHISEGRFKDSIRDSIHAVESAAKTASSKSNATLGDALSALERQKPLHPALRQSLSKLYGWTSDEKGIRHAEIGPEAPVPEQMALFMLSSCAAFSSWILNSFTAEMQ